MYTMPAEEGCIDTTSGIGAKVVIDLISLLVYVCGGLFVSRVAAVDVGRLGYEAS